MSMSRTFDYLVCFSVYSLIILIIGKSSFGESDSIGKFFIGERKCGFWRLFCTFVGTWVSAATILGYTGNVFENGTSVIAVTVIPWFIGAGLLYLISGRIYDCDMLTIPQFIGERYHSRFLRTCCALLLSGGYVFYLVIQIKGFGIAAATLLNIDYKVAIFLVYLFILYSTFGGFNSVTKTDGGNLIMLTISIVVVYFVVVGGIEGSGFLTNAEVFSRNAAGSGTDSFGNLMKDYSLTMYLTMFFGWGMGLAANPQYLIRIVAAKSRETARKVLICSLVFLTFFYFCLTQIGLGLRILFPYLSYYFGSDDIFVYAINYLLRSRFSGFFLISVIGACSANLHQLAAGHHHLFAAGGGRQHQQHRCGVIIHNAGIFRAGQLAQQLRQRAVAVPASGAVQIVLQRYGRLHGLHDRGNGLFRLLRAPQVGMQHGSGQVYHRA